MKPIFAALKAADCRVEEMLHRFSGNEAIAESFLRRFPADPNFDKLKAALEEDNLQEAFFAAHTMKGNTGNLALTPIYQAVCILVEDLRSEKMEEGKKHFSAVEKAYREICAIINNAE